MNINELKEIDRFFIKSSSGSKIEVIEYKQYIDSSAGDHSGSTPIHSIFLTNDNREVYQVGDEFMVDGYYDEVFQKIVK